jgi:hypothetical protein
MPTFDEIRADFERGVRTAGNDIERVFGRHHETSAAPAAATATIGTSNPGGPVSLLDELEGDVKNFAIKIASADKTAYAKMEQIQANPGAMSLVDAALGYLHLPPEAFSAAVAVLGEISKLYVLPQPAAAEPSFTPAGPQVAGQA